MSLADAMLWAVGLPAALLTLGILFLALTNRGSPGTDPAQRDGFEASVGKKLPVWIGGLSLALSGFFLVKYSIEQGLLTVHLRLLLGFVFGVVLIMAAGWVRLLHAADNSRIAQALSGAGVAVLYTTVYAASAVYGTVPPMTGFIGLVAVTAAAVVLSLRYGMGVALLGLLAGYLLPAFVPVPEPKAEHLFFYLFALTAGIFTIVHLRNWWALGGLALFSGISWVVMWGVGPFFSPADCLPMGLFVLGVSTMVAIFTPVGFTRPDWSDFAAYISWITAVPLMTFVTVRSGYGLDEWHLFAALSLGSFIAAYYRPQQYRYAPWVCLAFGVTTLFLWAHAPTADLAVPLLYFAAVFGTGSAALLHLRPAVSWASLMGLSASAFYALGCAFIGYKVYGLLPLLSGGNIWSSIAAIVALLFAILTASLYRRLDANRNLQEGIVGTSALFSALFLLASLVKADLHDWLPSAVSAEIFLLCWLGLKLEIKAFRKISALIAVFFVLSLTAYFPFVSNYFLNYSFPNLPVTHFDSYLQQFGLPMLLFASGAGFARKQKGGLLAEMLEATTVALAALLIFGAVMQSGLGFVGLSIITNLLLMAALAARYAGQKFDCPGYRWSGAVLFFFALFRIFYMDMMVQNPLFSGSVGDTLFFNSLLPTYALPVFWLWLGQRPAVKMPIPKTANGIMSLILLFTFVSLNVRNYFHGPILSQGPTTDAEIYAYSAIWLILGGILLALGALQKDKPLRVASLGIVVFTVGKVFLYDARTLDGLYRVFSFFGLGVSLIALSWFYSRFVFRTSTRSDDGTPPR